METRRPRRGQIARISLPALLISLTGLGALTAGCHRSSGPTTVSTITPGGPVTITPGPGGGGGTGTVSAPRPGAYPNPGGPPFVPDPRMTPGAVLPVTKADICVPGYTKKVRNVPQSVKNQVYQEYGITHRQPGEFEVDHLISLELGGSNSIKNLWPQSYVTQPWNAHVKDQLENELHDEICDGRISMQQAQHDIATDWIAAYKKYFHTNVPLANAGRVRLPGQGRSRRAAGPPAPNSGGAGPRPHFGALIGVPPVTRAAGGGGPAFTTSAPGGAGQVWVNLSSGKYFQPGSSHYGHTKRGQYMSEADAVRQGYVAAKGD